jgi:hypothetical protein
MAGRRLKSKLSAAVDGTFNDSNIVLIRAVSGKLSAVMIAVRRL